MATLTKTKKKSIKRAGVTRHPKFSALEQAIIADGVGVGQTKALAIKALRDWESKGLDPETIAGALRFHDHAKDLGAAKKTDEDSMNKFIAAKTPSNDTDLDAMLSQLMSESGDNEDQEDEDEISL
jgi:hypothetical protein